VEVVLVVVAAAAPATGAAAASNIYIEQRSISVTASVEFT